MRLDVVEIRYKPYMYIAEINEISQNILQSEKKKKHNEHARLKLSIRSEIYSYDLAE